MAPPFTFTRSKSNDSSRMTASACAAKASLHSISPMSETFFPVRASSFWTARTGHTHQWGPGKNFEGTGAFGPWMVTRDEIGDGEILTLETRLNSEVMQHATTDMLLFPIPTLISYVSSFTTLEPGDVIVTGTPGGIGMKRNPPVYMKAGDVVEIEVSRVGVLRNTIVAE